MRREGHAEAIIVENGHIGAEFTVHVTDFNYHIIEALDQHPPAIDIGHGLTTTAPVTVQGEGVCDFINETIYPQGLAGGQGGGVVQADGSELQPSAADLSIHSGKYVPGHHFNIAAIFGEYTLISIPDLYAVDANGGLIADQELYSLVNLATYLAMPLTFTLDETFDVVNGQVAGLPGMSFSTDPFSFSPEAGFTDPPYSGPATVFTWHDMEAVPEAATWMLMALGFAGLGYARMRRSAAAPPEASLAEPHSDVVIVLEILGSPPLLPFGFGAWGADLGRSRRRRKSRKAGEPSGRPIVSAARSAESAPRSRRRVQKIGEMVAAPLRPAAQC